MGITSCIEMCVPGCFCRNGFIRDHRGDCISDEECKERVKESQCFQELAEATVSAEEEMMVGVIVPSCEENGNYSPVQCHGSTGFCWCAERDGSEIEETRIRGEPKCSRGTFCAAGLN